MNLFETVKSAVTVKQAAEHYGCKVNRGDMICCPFHDDRHPSWPTTSASTQTSPRQRWR